jgi:hypothetical protein
LYVSKKNGESSSHYQCLIASENLGAEHNNRLKQIWRIFRISAGLISKIKAYNKFSAVFAALPNSLSGRYMA